MAPVVVTTVFALLAAVAVVLVALLVTGRDGSPVTFLCHLRSAVTRRGGDAEPALASGRRGRSGRAQQRRVGLIAEMRELADVEDGDVEEIFHVGRPAPGYLETTELQGALMHARQVASSLAPRSPRG